MKKESASQIVSRAGMVSRPEYYSGRGAIMCDLNSNHLEKIYQGIVENYGKEAGENFIQMVIDIPKLSATDFLVTLFYSLEAANWVWKKKKSTCSTSGIEVGKNADGEYDQASGIATIGEILSGNSDRDETNMIRSPFLRSHGKDVNAPRPRGAWLP